jgi:hypothetical protein
VSAAGFGTSIRRDPDDTRGLKARIDALVLERLEEVVDNVCLEVMVEARRQAGRPTPVAESAEERRELEALVAEFLRRLHAGIRETVTPDERAELTPSAPEDRAAFLAVHVTLAKRLPDYWQRFEQVRQAFVVEQRQGPAARAGFLRQLLGRRSGKAAGAD